MAFAMWCSKHQKLPFEILSSYVSLGNCEAVAQKIHKPLCEHFYFFAPKDTLAPVQLPNITGQLRGTPLKLTSIHTATSKSLSSQVHARFLLHMHMFQRCSLAGTEEVLHEMAHYKVWIFLRKQVTILGKRNCCWRFHIYFLTPQESAVYFHYIKENTGISADGSSKTGQFTHQFHTIQAERKHYKTEEKARTSSADFICFIVIVRRLFKELESCDSSEKERRDKKY